MKNLVYLASIFSLTCLLILFNPMNARGQSSSQQGIPKDSLSKKVLYSTSAVAAIQTIGNENVPAKAVSINHQVQTNNPVQTHSALTGPGKVVTGMVLLSCLFFYFNRKK